VDTDVWSADAAEAAVDTYLTGARIEQIARLVERSQNAVVWKLWSLAGARSDLREQMLARGDAMPLRYADIRIRKVAFRWVLVHLRSAAGGWIDAGQDVTLEALSKQAENALLLWAGRPSAAEEIEQTVAHWLVDHPDLWQPPASNEGSVQDGGIFNIDAPA
jgi:hypothetical protein